MQLSPIGLPVSELDTPALLIDLAPLEENIARMAGHFSAVASHGVPMPRRSSARRLHTCCAGRVQSG